MEDDLWEGLKCIFYHNNGHCCFIFYKAGLVGKSQLLPIWLDLSLDHCQKLLVQNHDDFSQIMKGIIDELISYLNSTGEKFSNTRAAILIHVLFMVNIIAVKSIFCFDNMLYIQLVRTILFTNEIKK